MTKHTNKTLDKDTSIRFFNKNTDRYEIVTVIATNDIEECESYFSFYIDIGPKSELKSTNLTFRRFGYDFPYSSQIHINGKPKEIKHTLLELSILQAAAKASGWNTPIGPKNENLARQQIKKFINQGKKIHIFLCSDHPKVTIFAKEELTKLVTNIDSKGRIYISLLDSSEFFIDPVEEMESNPHVALKRNPYWNPEKNSIDASFCILKDTIRLTEVCQSIPVCISPSNNEPGDFSDTDSLILTPTSHDVCKPITAMKNYAESIVRQALASVLIISTMNRHIPEGSSLGDERTNLNRFLKCSPIVDIHFYTDIKELREYLSPQLESFELVLDPVNRVRIQIHEYH